MKNDNAKIQFTVKFDQIPKEVASRMGENARRYTDLRTLVESAVDKMSRKDIPESIKLLEQLRGDLAYIDMVFEDCYNILVGYTSYQAKLVEAAQQPTKPAAQNADDQQV